MSINIGNNNKIKNSIIGNKKPNKFWKQIKKELDRDFEISIYVIILIVGLSILVFSCMKASYEITKLKEENNELRTNINRIESQESR